MLQGHAICLGGDYGQTRDEQGCEEGEEVSGKGTL